MKAGDLAKVLRDYGALLRDAGLNRVAEGLDVTAGSTVAAALKKRHEVATGPGDRGVARQLEGLAQFLSPIAKAGVAKDILSVAAFVGEFGAKAFDAPLQPIGKRGPARRTPTGLNETLVSESVDRLTAALGKSNFTDVFEDLVARTSSKEIVAIAKRFTPGTAKSAADAKKRIWSRHQELVGTAARSRATSGRSAA